MVRVHWLTGAAVVLRSDLQPSTAADSPFGLRAWIVDDCTAVSPYSAKPWLRLIGIDRLISAA